MINEICRPKQDLTYNVIGFECTYHGPGVYIYEGSQIKTIHIDRLTAKSWIFIPDPLSVDSIFIMQGNMEFNIYYAGKYGIVPSSNELSIHEGVRKWRTMCKLSLLIYFLQCTCDTIQGRQHYIFIWFTN